MVISHFRRSLVAWLLLFAGACAEGYAAALDTDIRIDSAYLSGLQSRERITGVYHYRSGERIDPEIA